MAFQVKMNATFFQMNFFAAFFQAKKICNNLTKSSPARSTLINRPQLLALFAVLAPVCSQSLHFFGFLDYIVSASSVIRKNQPKTT
jgi:hypothetical protein